MSLDLDGQIRRGEFAVSVRLTASESEVVAVLGPNGAGKSTILETIAGLRRVESGRCRLDGELVDEPSSDVWVAPQLRPVGFVFQDYLLFPHMTALQNVSFGVECGGADKRQARTRAREWLDRLGIEALAGASPAELSGGEAQKVALARALAREPSVLLLDEPLAALDASSRIAVRRELGEHLTEYAGTTVLVTHDPVDALILADRLVVLENGEVVQEGTAAEIRAHPRSGYVADLVGRNLFRGEADHGVISLNSGARLVTADDRSGLVFAVVDPSAVTLHPTEPHGSARNVWELDVTAVEHLGSRVRVLTKGALELTAEVTPAAIEELGIRAGTRIWATVKATEVRTHPA
ncbi:MAG: Molybdenum import ATP-binding protein ModC [Acidimicrobiales bacterium]|nr:MAG: ATP-binding cassette domain-containing protein [Actinomycetota bacterium]MBV6507749.1 Molybdenum import ATP-binding protein ModC [Acidimicrobiales bacterium]RIK06175.1 MAG: ABC transporter ATP-binding protein [Acidobacteriota bacterium]